MDSNMKKLNAAEMNELNAKELTEAEMDQAAGGFLGFLFPVMKKVTKDILDIFR